MSDHWSRIAASYGAADGSTIMAWAIVSSRGGIAPSYAGSSGATGTDRNGNALRSTFVLSTARNALRSDSSRTVRSVGPGKGSGPRLSQVEKTVSFAFFTASRHAFSNRHGRVNTDLPSQLSTSNEMNPPCARR